jgi:hypothetical protein
VSAAPPRRVGSGALIAIALVAVALVIGAIVLLPRIAGPIAGVPSPSVTASPAPSSTASGLPTATASTTPTAASGRFVNAALGYSIQLTPPWRRTACLSVGPDPTRPDLLGIDGFTSVPAGDESYGDTGGLFDTVSVRVDRNADRLTAAVFANSPRMGSTQAQRLEPARLDGREGVRVINGALQTETTLVAVDDLMYLVGFTATAGDPLVGAMRGIVASFAFVPRTAVSIPTARPARSAESVADGLADGFARKDVSVLASLMGDCMISGAEQAGFGSHSPERFARILRDAFVAGTTVVVRPRPIESAPGYGAGASVTIATTWTDPGQAPTRVDLIIGVDGAFSSWRGMVRRQQPLPQSAPRADVARTEWADHRSSAASGCSCSQH